MLSANADQRGSLPMALLVSIIVAGVVVALFSVVQSGQRSAARDRDVAQALQVADAGVQEALVRLAEVAALDLDVVSADDVELLTPINTSTDPQVGTSGTGNYEWEARRIGPRLWQVRSVGTYRTHTTVVEAEVGQQGVFPFALWGSDGLDIQQGATAIAHATPDGVPLIGSNGRIRLQTQVVNDLIAGDIGAHCYSDEDGASPTQNCIDFLDGPEVTLFPGQTYTIEDLGSAAYSPQDGEIGGQCYRDGEVVDDGVFDGAFPGSSSYADRPFRLGETYCFSDVRFPGGQGGIDYLIDTTNDPDPAYVAGDGEGDDAVRIYIAPSGTLTVTGSGAPNAPYVNWSPRNAVPATLGTSAADLLIFVGGGGSVTMDNNHAKIAAAILAPRSTCVARTQSTIFGSMICGAIDNQGAGGWSITYDPDLSEVFLDGVYGVRTWSQEACSSTGFSWDAEVRCP